MRSILRATLQISLAATVALVTLPLSAAAPSASKPSNKRLLRGHFVAPSLLDGAREIAPPSSMIALAVRLPLRNGEKLDGLLEELYRKGGPLEGAFLSPAEFARTFGASAGELREVERYFRGLGCLAGARSPSRLLLDVSCPQDQLERALEIKITWWRMPEGALARTIDRDPSVPGDLSIEAIHGLSSVPRRPHLIRQTALPLASGGSGPNGGLAPADITSAYALTGLGLDGSGITLGLFELDGYAPSDVAAYEKNFKLPAVPLQNVLVDGVTGAAGDGADEVTLDIELMNGIAPHASKIIVYEGPNTDAGVVDTYQRIASDGLARETSTSWGLTETSATPAMRNSENTIFKQLAAQGQAIFAAAGDRGAFDDGTTTVTVDDPASQPYVSGAGGTMLTFGTNHTYSKETTWWNATLSEGGGGGISTVWPIPSWQVGVGSVASLASTAQRNVPDVALNSDPSVGYSAYVGGKWNVYGGTSCAAPLWAGFMALVNQRRAENSLAPVGFANPALYSAGAAGFHDVADGSTNGKYPAVSGYDLATGRGSLDGAALVEALGGDN
jgi:kumamolisin